ncbi:MAG: ArsA family ATPase [Deltaproteobacteria bacterium]|nr:ArsA family ATPase [Deltaproteobacteria bacterium]
MKILFFTGKGGVGKSTISAAAAWQLSQRHRVLIISLDPAHNLGDVFGVTLKDKKYRFSDRLSLREVDLQQRSREYLTREITVLTQTYRYLQTINLDNYFSILKYSPGIEEYALLTGIEETIRSEEDIDFLIFDTPPTGLTLRFLALPKVTITWIDRLLQIRRAILEKRYTIYRIRGPLDDKETLLNYSEDDDDAIRRLKALRENYQSLCDILQGKDCGVVIVFNPDVLSLRESQRLIEGLNDLELPLRLMINNRITERNSIMADHVDGVMKGFAPGVPIGRVSLADQLLDRRDGSLYDIAEDLSAYFTAGFKE